MGSTAPSTPNVDVLGALRDDHYTLGTLRIVPYNRLNRELFGDNLLNMLYDACVASRPSHPFGILPDTQCGMPDLSRDAIVGYWASRNLILLTVSDPAHMDVISPCLADGSYVAGFSYPVAFQGAPAAMPGYPQPTGPRSALAAYAFFRPWWGTGEIEILGMLGLAYLFETYNLSAIHGQRYPHNELTARFMSKYGNEDVGVIPRFMLDRRRGKVDGEPYLEDCVISSLFREDFEKYVEHQLLQMLALAHPGGDPAV